MHPTIDGPTSPVQDHRATTLSPSHLDQPPAREGKGFHKEIAMKNIVAYIRVSTEEQKKEGVSPAAQRERIVAYCKMRDLNLVEIVEDLAVSGTIPIAKREGGAKLIALLKTGVAEAVVAVKLDRVFRNAADCLATVTGPKGWDDAGIALHIIDMGGNAIDTKTAIGKFTLAVLASAAQMERDLTSERTKSALAYMKKHNRSYSHTPFGMTRTNHTIIVNGEPKIVGTLSPNECELEALARIRSLRALGKSLRAICLALSDVPTKNGGKWATSTVAKLLERKG